MKWWIHPPSTPGQVREEAQSTGGGVLEQHKRHAVKRKSQKSLENDMVEKDVITINIKQISLCILSKPSRI